MLFVLFFMNYFFKLKQYMNQQKAAYSSSKRKVYSESPKTTLA